MQPVLILGIIGFGMGVGALAQLVLGRRGSGIDWGMALGAGLIGSFVGGLLFSLIAGDGLAVKVSRILGSFIGGPPAAGGELPDPRTCRGMTPPRVTARDELRSAA